ncbi:MAG: histidine kinase [Eubacteriales bacterium]
MIDKRIHEGKDTSNFILRKKLYISLGILSISVIFCCAVYYVKVMQNIEETNKKYVEQISNGIISTMNSILLNIEHVAIAMSENEEVIEFIEQEEPLKYYEQSKVIQEELDAIYQQDGLVDHIIIYNDEYHYYRLRGELGNTSCDRLGFLLQEKQQTGQLVVSLEGDDYIAYVTSIYKNEKSIGKLVFMIKNEKLIDLFHSYDAMAGIQIGLVADDVILVATDDALTGEEVEVIEQGMRTYHVGQIGYTPFQVVVMDDGGFIFDSLKDFFVLLVVIIGILIGIIFMFFKFSNRVFFNPMFQIMESVQQIIKGKETHILHMTGEQEFDELVIEINSMIDQLDENSKRMLQMQYEIQGKEIEKQQLTISFLKKQINAHFMVNTLNVIKRLQKLGENEKAEKMCNGLAQLLRYANETNEYEGGFEEMKMLERYIEIMNIRYPNLFTWSFEVDDRMDDILIPRMLLQPIVENAVMHGLEPMGKGGLLICAHVRKEEVRITISDTGCGISENTLALLQKELQDMGIGLWKDQGIEHIALANIQSRIISLFGKQYGLTIQSEENKGTIVTVILPTIEK